MEKNVLSTKVTNSTIKYVEHRGGDVAALLDGIPYDRDYLTSVDKWVPAALQCQLLERAELILGEKDAARNAGRFNATPKVLGLMSTIARLFANPRILYGKGGAYVHYFSRAQVGRSKLVGENECIFEISHSELDSYRYCGCEQAMGILEAVPTLFGLPLAIVKKETCALPIAKAGKVHGLYYNVNEQGNVEAFFDEARTQSAGVKGQLEEDGSFVVDGIKFGAECCRYHIHIPANKSLLRKVREFLFSRLIVSNADYVGELERTNESLEKQFDELKRRDLRLTRQKELGMALIQQQTLEEVFSLVTSSIIEIGDALSCRIYLVEPDNSIRYAQGGFSTADENQYDSIQNLISDSNFQPDNLDLSKHPQVMKIFSSGKPHVVNDIGDFMAPFWPREFCEAINEKSGLRQLLLLPLRANNESLGIVAVISKKEIDVESLEPIANAAAQAIRNHRRNEQIRRQKESLERLRDIQLAMNQKKGLEEVLNYIVQSAQELTSSLVVRLFLGDPEDENSLKKHVALDRDKISNFVEAGKNKSPFLLDSLDVNENYMFKTFSQKGMEKSKVAHFDGIRRIMEEHWPVEFGRWVDEGLGIKDVAGAPLEDKGQILGAMMFTSDHILEDDLLLMLAGQASQAIRNAQYIEEIERSKYCLDVKVKARTEELEATNSELRKTQAFIIQQEKMASIGQLAAGVAHEINNPLGYIHSNLNSLHSYMPNLKEYVEQLRSLNEYSLKSDDKFAREKAEQAEKLADEFNITEIMDDIEPLVSECMEGTNRAKNIVINLKNFSCPAGNKSTLADVNAGIESTIAVIWNELKYHSNVHKELGDVPLIPCYPQELNQVVLNLLLNAAHSLKKHGNIWVRSRSQNGSIEIEVEDDGEGIPPENISRIFDPFFTTKPIGKGTGLGLTISYGIVKKHNGDIMVESEPGKGSKFTVRIPKEEIALEDDYGENMG